MRNPAQTNRSPAQTNKSPMQGWKATSVPKPGGGNKVTFTKYECDVCHKLFSGKSGLYYHMVTHTGNYKFYCNMCDRGFMQAGMYKRHLQAHRKQLGTADM